MGKVDYLRGFKENVIMGHIIPAGTGFRSSPQGGVEAAGGTACRKNRHRWWKNRWLS